MNNSIKNILGEFNFKDEQEAIITLREKVIFYIKKNEFETAQKFNNKLLILISNDYQTNRDDAFIKYHLNDLKVAEKSIRKAFEINSQDVFGINIFALILISQKKYSRSIDYLQRAIEIDENYIDSYNNLGTCFFETERLDEAFKCFSKAFKINKNYPNTLINIGNILSLKDKYSYAINFFNKVLEVSPNNINVLNNIAICYCRKRDGYNAKKYFEKINQISINNHDLNYIYSTTLLNLGKYKQGWELFRSRFFLKKNYKFIKKIYLKKTNKKINFDKDKVLILREQGVGEEILFSSIYRKLLRNNNVRIESDPRLLSIFTRSFSKNIFYKEGYFSNKSALVKEFNHVIHAGSLCEYFINKDKDIDSSPYLVANQNIINKFKKNIFLKDNKKCKVGISWKSKISVYGELKSIKIEDFIPIFKENRNIFCLQYGNVENERKICKKLKKNLIFFEGLDIFNDFESLMGILNSIDIFITVSNSTAHIAAAMGVKTIILCPRKSSTYFYWDIKKKKSPWYKTVEIVTIEDSIKKTMEKINRTF